MVIKSLCKINIGLQIVSKREDGYHNLSTIMYPIKGCADLVELKPSTEDAFYSSGIEVDCDWQKNLCMKALRLLQERYNIGKARVWLHKQIPFGAGLGGGSANAVAVLKLANAEFELNLSNDTLENLAAELGSDTAFFVNEIPALATSRGEILQPIKIDLSQYYIYIVKPNVAISTAMAYSGVVPKPSPVELQDAINHPMKEWKELIVNDFEESLFGKFAELSKVKNEFYKAGALYASMSGSGSAVYGIFETPTDKRFDNLWHIEKPTMK